MMEGRNTGNVQGNVDEVRALVDAGDPRCFEVLGYKDKANVGVKCQKREC